MEEAEGGCLVWTALKENWIFQISILSNQERRGREHFPEFDLEPQGILLYLLNIEYLQWYLNEGLGQWTQSACTLISTNL